MQRTALFVVGLVFIATVVGGVGPALAQSDDELVTLTLEVVNPSSNQRLGGVTLLVTWDGGETTVATASNGMALVDVPEAASVEITTDDDQYTRNEPYRIRVATEREHTIEVARKAALDVAVTDANGPVADARVTLSQGGTVVASGQTDAEGRYETGTVEQGKYTLAVMKPGYYRTTEEVIVAGSPEETVRIEAGRVDYDVVVEDPHFDPAEPVTDATVSVEGVGTTTTDDRGAASTLLPVNSEFQVTVSKEGYETATRTVTTNESRGSLVLDLSREPSLSLTAVNQRVVVGEAVAVEVTNAYGEPAPGVAILVDDAQVAETDSDGRATVRIDEAGDRRIQARGGGTTSESVTVRGIGDGSGATDRPTATEREQVTETAVVTGADDSGLLPGGLGGLVGPLVAVVALLVVVGVAALYRRRRHARRADPSAWADDPLESPASGGGAGFGDDVGGEAADSADDPTASAAGDGSKEPGTGADEEPVAEGERGPASTQPGEDVSTDRETGSAGAGTDTDTDTDTEPRADETSAEPEAGAGETETATDEPQSGDSDDSSTEDADEPQSDESDEPK
jgi:hypothetical protein